MTLLLEAAGLTSHYGRIQALKGIDLSVRQGELLALVGANGAGKTTLLRTLSGVQPASGGTIRFGGEDITRVKAARRVSLGIAQVPEGRQVFGPLSVEDNLRLGAYTRNDKAEIAKDIEKMFSIFPRLRERKDQLAGTMSGGEQQMLAMGRALMSRPKVLLMDEPSMGLSPIMVDKIFEVVRDVHALGVTLVLVEQNASRALALADRGYVMESGLITMTGPGQTLLSDPRVRAAYLGE